MDEHNDQGQTRRRFGMSRRDLIRRGAIVGGTLIWTIPAVKTLSSADVAPGTSPFFTCCECRKRKGAAGSLRCSKEFLNCTTNKTETFASISYRTDLESGCSAWCGAQDFSYCFHRASTLLTCSAGDECSSHTSP